MDDVIAATGLSSSVVYRDFRGKDELIEAAAVESLRLFDDLISGLMADGPPPPAGLLIAMAQELQARQTHPDYDISRIAMQAWAEALRDPVLRERSEEFYRNARLRLAELAETWRTLGHLPPEADPHAVATVLTVVMPGLIVNHHLGSAIAPEQLLSGLTGIGAAVRGQPSTAN